MQHDNDSFYYNYFYFNVDNRYVSRNIKRETKVIEY